MSTKFDRRELLQRTAAVVVSTALSLMIFGMPLGASAQEYGVDDGTRLTENLDFDASSATV